MTDHVDSLDDPSADELAAIEALLSRADAWDDPPAHVEAAVVAAIADEAGFTAPTPLAERRRPRLAEPAWWLGAVAAVAVTVAGIAIITRGSETSDGVTFALAGTEAEPAASAEAIISATPAGMKILLDTVGLPGAPEGFMYEAWVSDGTIRVSAGTFHMRGGDNQIELWAGVADPTFQILSVTLEPVDGDETSSLDARLVGTFSLDD